VGKVETFLDAHRQSILGDIFADQTMVPLDDPSLDWLEPPAAELLSYARNRRRFPFDDNPDDPVNFKGPTGFLISQIHRISLTLDAIRRHLPPEPSERILDLGAFPFTLDIALREYSGVRNPILATVNQSISAQWRALLQPYQIDLMLANLDPLVLPPEFPEELTETMPAEDASIGLVILAHVIEHLYHPLKILKEANRVLKPGCRILLTTDNAFLARAFFNFLGQADFVHEPVEQTAAMTFHAWRGHVRFFSAADLKKLLEASGFSVIEVQFREALYNSFLEEYFHRPTRALPRFLVNLLTRFPYFRNELIVVGEKPSVA
jgi:SAM-dependent methyltransferase